MSMQQVPLLYRVVLLHAAVIGMVLATIQISTNIQAARLQGETIPTSVAPTASPATTTQPAHLQIKRIRIDVPVIAGKYNPADRTWLLSEDRAQYITGTTRNLTMIYGHNTAAVFELTNSLQVGDELLLTDTNGDVRRYTYVRDHLTVATDTSDLTATYARPTLALLTCNGFWSQDRRFMFFEPVEESRS